MYHAAPPRPDHAVRECTPRARLLRLAVALGLSTLLLGGCAVVAVVDVAASAVVGVAGLAVDAAVGTARIGGKIIGAGADAALDPDEPEDE
ncbi:hypothetical protein [Hydrogenophaga taeniospiralis]|uniref:hypothetical protein n=1 Tax=Hydrogenophaga taeniospiralis TaxID=65656 RepID=UPI001CFC2A60|nr:hypothetical protein [Hydrogenophaga taeniospiralis]